MTCLPSQALVLTLAFPLVLGHQVRVPPALGSAECALVAVRGPIRAAHWALEGVIGAVRSADATRLVSPVQLAFLPRTAVHVIARLCTDSRISRSVS